VTPANRQQIIRDIVIEHTRYVDAIEALSQFHYPVKNGLPSKGTISLLMGDSRTGKSFAARKYAKHFPEQIGETGKIKPLVYVDMPMESGGGARAILEAFAAPLEVPHSKRLNNPGLTSAILQAAKRQEVDMFLLDEFDQIFRKNDKNLIGFGRGLIRKLVDTGASVTVIGLKPTYELLKDDPQIVGRGLLPRYELKPYRWSLVEERDEFRALCQAFDQEMPFPQKSRLGAVGLAHQLFWATEGNIGRLKSLIDAAAFHAINDDSSHITQGHFAIAFDVRKDLGTTFNPFVHDLSRAPKLKATDAVKNGGTQTVFSLRAEPQARPL
jgi:hypothetical protein